jgi:hypothetical protein
VQGGTMEGIVLGEGRAARPPVAWRAVRTGD